MTAAGVDQTHRTILAVWRVEQPRLITSLARMLRGVAEGKSNLEIAKALFVSEGTVKAHVKAILQKLGALPV